MEWQPSNARSETSDEAKRHGEEGVRGEDKDEVEEEDVEEEGGCREKQIKIIKMQDLVFFRAPVGFAVVFDQLEAAVLARVDVDLERAVREVRGRLEPWGRQREHRACPKSDHSGHSGQS